MFPGSTFESMPAMPTSLLDGVNGDSSGEGRRQAGVGTGMKPCSGVERMDTARRAMVSHALTAGSSQARQLPLHYAPNSASGYKGVNLDRTRAGSGHKPYGVKVRVVAT